MKAGTRSLSILWNSPTRIAIVGQLLRNFLRSGHSFHDLAQHRVLVESMIVRLPKPSIEQQVAPPAKITTPIIQTAVVPNSGPNSISEYNREMRKMPPEN